MVIRILNSMKKDIETMKNNQTEMKNDISEMKNTLEGMICRLDEARDRMSELEDKVEKKSFNQSSKREEKTPAEFTLIWEIQTNSFLKYCYIY